MEQLIEGEPQLLLHNGKFIEPNLRQAQVTRREVIAAIHKAGYADPEGIRAAIAKTSGASSTRLASQGSRNSNPPMRASLGHRGIAGLVQEPGGLAQRFVHLGGGGALMAFFVPFFNKVFANF